MCSPLLFAGASVPPAAMASSGRGRTTTVRVDALLPRPFRPTAGKLGTRRTRGRVRWQPLLYVPAAVAFARLRRRLGPPPAPVTVAVVYAAPAVVAYALPRGRVRYALGWLCHMWAYKVAFEVPYDHRDRQRSRLRITTPVAIDRLIGFGVPPSQRLQRRLRRPPQLAVL